MENEPTPEQKRDAELRAELETKRHIERYIRAQKAYEAAVDEWTFACNAMRENLGEQAKFVAKVDFVTYLVATDKDSNISVEKIKVLH